MQDQRTEQARRVAEMTHYALLAMQHQTGADAATVLAGAHAEIATSMALHFGREAAIAQCKQVAERLRTLPSADDLAFAAHPAAGTA